MAKTVRKYSATPGEVAKQFGICARTVRRWAQAGKVPYRMTPSGPRFNLEELDEQFTPETVTT